MRKEIFTLIFICMAIHLSGQNMLYPDSMVLKSLAGNSLNKQISEYDDRGNEHIRTYYIRNKHDDDWLKYMEFTYQWDNRGNQVSEMAFVQDTVLNEWVGMHKYLSRLDKYGNETEKIYWWWNKQLNEWVEYFKQTAEFNDDGLKIGDILYMKENDQWIENQYKSYQYEYDESGNLKTMFQFRLLNSNNVKSYMNARYKYEYEYDEQGYLISSEYYECLDEHQWIPKYRYEYEYDSKGNQILEIYSIGDPEYHDWIKFYKYGHSYNDAGNLTAMFYYSWNREEHDWEGFYNYKYYYDPDNNPDYIDLYVWDDGDWRFNEKAYYYYSGGQILDSQSVTGEELSIRLYPNPTTDILRISGAENTDLTIFDSQGRIVYTKKNLGELETVQTASWASGVYFATFQQGETRTTRKIIKK
ncbi:hypothetical protein M2132_002306 [Dysgonomonas sp. PH5-45]|uniref:T9SS type A sorting domain-containing protein n=1 Tax=unclassified Dysgonomonas TaxID=2630389 RepID=UPI002473331F|nr:MULTISPECIES: T9SS type A sorting domain-containing protein [unclassified Dysgonomonas]MDH6355955.1 hypothetical protein [Dysgonomonas sp. PH5-45]MDH6388844.1 hypothetical protein [Dysgonomonas sp. PH5-37]